MFTKRSLNAETRAGWNVHKILSGLAIKAHAEEKPADEGDKTPEVNYEQLIAQARKEEKDKLYPRIQKLEEENKTLTKSNNNYLLQIAALKDELEKLKSAGDSDEVKTLKQTIADLQGQIETLKNNAVDEEAIRKKVADEYEVKMYAQEQIALHKGSILSTLIPDIKGATKEEVDAAIKTAKETTKTVKKELGLEVDDEEDDNKDKTPGKKSKKGSSTPAKRVPPASPPTETEEEDYDVDYIRNLDPSSEEYKQFRKSIGLR